MTGNPFTESVDDGVLYPDDLEGKTLELVGDRPVEADEVDHENAQYGMFVQVDDGTGEKWASAPRGLREFLGHAVEEHGTTDLVFLVSEVEKGPRDHDPYEVDARVTHVDGEQVD